MDLGGASEMGMMALGGNSCQRDELWWRAVQGRDLLLVLCAALLLFCFACSAETEGKQKKRTTAPVTIGSVVQKDVPVQLLTIGNVEPYASVAVKSMVSGQLIKIAFKEGQEVKKGDLLFVIDPRPFEAALNQAEAILERDLSAVKQAQANRASNASELKHTEAILTKDEIQAKTAGVQAERYGKVMYLRMNTIRYRQKPMPRRPWCSPIRQGWRRPGPP